MTTSSPSPINLIRAEINNVTLVGPPIREWREEKIEWSAKFLEDLNLPELPWEGTVLSDCHHGSTLNEIIAVEIKKGRPLFHASATFRWKHYAYADGRPEPTKAEQQATEIARLREALADMIALAAAAPATAFDSETEVALRKRIQAADAVLGRSGI